MAYNKDMNLENDTERKNEVSSEHKLVISVEEMARMLSISRPFAYKLSHQAGFPVIVLGKRRLINVEALQHWLNENMANANTNGGNEHGKEAC